MTSLSMLTSWKKQEDLQFLNEVSSVPLQQGLRHLMGSMWLDIMQLVVNKPKWILTIQLLQQTESLDIGE